MVGMANVGDGDDDAMVMMLIATPLVVMRPMIRMVMVTKMMVVLMMVMRFVLLVMNGGDGDDDHDPEVGADVTVSVVQFVSKEMDVFLWWLTPPREHRNQATGPDQHPELPASPLRWRHSCFVYQ